MRAQLIRTVPVLAALALMLAVAGTADPPMAAAGAALVAAALATAWVGSLVVTGPRRASLGATAAGGRRSPRAEPAPQHPDTPGRARPRAPGRDLLAA